MSPANFEKFFLLDHLVINTNEPIRQIEQPNPIKTLATKSS